MTEENDLGLYRIGLSPGGNIHQSQWLKTVLRRRNRRCRVRLVFVEKIYILLTCDSEVGSTARLRIKFLACAVFLLWILTLDHTEFFVLTMDSKEILLQSIYLRNWERHPPRRKRHPSTEGNCWIYSPIEGGFKGGVPFKLFSCLDFSFYPFEKYPDFVRCAKP